MPHCLRVASDVDHANTTSVSFFHEDATVLFGGPCRLCVLLNGSSNSGSLIQNGNCISSYTLSAHKILSSTSTHSSEESCVGLHYSCETRALRGERPVFCHRKHSILARRRQQDVSQPALLAWVVYGPPGVGCVGEGPPGVGCVGGRPSWRGLCTGKGWLPQSWGRRWDCGDSLSLLLRPGGVQSCVPLGLVGKVLRNPHTGIILRLYLAFMLRCHLLPALFSWDKLSTSFSISVVLASVAESPSEHTWSQAIPGHSFQATNSIRSIVNLVSSREESCILHTD